MNTENKTFQLHMGALAPSIADQLKQQGFTVDKDLIKRFQKIHDSIIMLRVHGFLNDSNSRKASQKLTNEIGKSIKIK